MKLAIFAASLVIGFSSLFSSSQALAGACHPDIKCIELNWGQVTCQELRNAIVNHDVVYYGSSDYYNVTLFSTNQERSKFCREHIRWNSNARRAITTRTSDTWSCQVWDIAFQCRQQIDH